MARRKLTVPKTPKLRTLNRAKLRQAYETKQTAKKVTIFKARGIPKSVFKAEPLPERKSKRATIPVTPALMKRKAKKQTINPTDLTASQFKARPLMIFSPPRIAPSDRPLTQPRPFQLETDSRGEMYQRRQQAMIQMQAEHAQQQANFVAGPIIEDEWQPEIVTKEATQVQPFSMPGESFRQQYKEQSTAEHAAREQEEKEAREFHAEPLVESAPFVPSLSDKDTTVPKTPALTSKDRADQRRLWDEEQEAKRLAEEARAKADAEQRTRIEEIAIRKLRKKMVFKAQPVPKATTFTTKPSDKAPTTAKTPKIKFGGWRERWGRPKADQ